ncbi:MAG: riboflavin biosynthesis protein RibF [Flavobacteriales bacterium]|nr:riboflavin biosynthesis protein RibF [Flavobacteriales bacterium]
MKIYQGIEQFEKLEKAVVTTGTFDGVHIGHRTILNRLIEVAKKMKGESVLLTFYPHPRMVLQEDAELRLLNTIDEKTQLLEKAGIDHLIIHPFTKEFSRTTSLEFVRDLLVNQIGTKKLVIGYDHHFGRNREGSFEHLKEYGPVYGFEVEEIPAQDIDDVNVSSTKIRKALVAGDVKTANNYLGHNFQLNGVVVHGNKVGRELGYPTANIDLQNKYKLIPAEGIYAVKVRLKDESYNGMLNIGRRPTINSGNGEVSIEVNIFDFKKEIYGEKIQLELIERIRDEKKFDSKDELIAEMQKDQVKCERILLH